VAVGADTIVKKTHRANVFCWSRFDEARDVDFNAWAWLREGQGSVLIDPLPLSDHDRAQLEAHGPVSHVIVTNSDHTRAAAEIAARYGALTLGPRQEEGKLGIPCDRWIGGEEIVPGLRAIELAGSKTPGELALVLEDTTLITGDLLRAHAGASLHLLPDAKLGDKARAIESVRALATLPLEAILVGDGWPIFEGARAKLDALVARLG
jgi:hypothetical protein